MRNKISNFLLFSLNTAFVVTLFLLDPASASFSNNNNNQDEDQRRADLEDLDKRGTKRAKTPPKEKEEMGDDEGNQANPEQIDNEDEAANYVGNKKRTLEDAFGEDKEKEDTFKADQYGDPVGELHQIIEKFNLNDENEEDQTYIDIVNRFVNFKPEEVDDSSQVEIATSMLSLARIEGLKIYSDERHKSFWFYTFMDNLAGCRTSYSEYILDNELTALDIDQFYNDFGSFFPEEIHQLFVYEVNDVNTEFYETIKATKLLGSYEKSRLLALLNTIKGNRDLNDSDETDDAEKKGIVAWNLCGFITMYQEFSDQEKDLVHEIANKIPFEDIEVSTSYNILDMFTRQISYWNRQANYNYRKKILDVTSDIVKKAVDSCKADPDRSVTLDRFVHNISICLCRIIELVNNNLDKEQWELIHSLLFNFIKYSTELNYKEDYISIHSLQALKLLIDKMSPVELGRLNKILDQDNSLSYDIFTILAEARATSNYQGAPEIYMNLEGETPAMLNLIKDVLLKSSYPEATYIIQTLADIREGWLNQKWVNKRHANCQSTDAQIIKLFSSFSPSKLYDTLICIKAGLVDLSAVDLNVRMKIFAELNDDVLSLLGRSKFGESIKLDDPKFDYTPLFNFLNRVPGNQADDALRRISQLMHKQSPDDRKSIINNITKLRNPDRFIDLLNFTGKLVQTPRNGERELLVIFISRLKKLDAAHTPELDVIAQGGQNLPRISDTWTYAYDLDAFEKMLFFGPNCLDKLVQLAHLLNKQKIDRNQYTCAGLNTFMLPADFDISYESFVTFFNSLRQSRNQDGLNRIFDHWKSLFTHEYAPRARTAIKYVVDHKIQLGLNDDDEIVQLAIRMLTQQDPNNQKSPYTIHSNLLSKKKEITQWSQIPAVSCQLDGFRLKLNAEKLAGLHSCFAYDLESVPTIAEDEFVATLNSVKEILKVESEQRTTLMQAVGRVDHAKFISEIDAHLKSESHVRTLLRAPSNHVQGSKLKCVLNSIKSSPTDAIRLERLVKFLSTTRNCADGQNTAINGFYTILEAEHRLRTKVATTMLNVSCEEQSLIKRLNDCMQLTIGNLIGSGSQFLKALCSQGALNQEVHQVIYVKNLIGDRVGLADPLAFDIYAGHVDPKLLEMSCQEMLNIYYKMFNLQDFMHQTLTKFNTVVRECQGTSERDELYNAIRDICEKNTGSSYNVVDWFDWNDELTEFTGLNQNGFVEVMKHVGLLEDDQTYMN